MTEEFIKKALAPDVNERQRRAEAFKNVSLYIIIALISIIVVFIVPLLSGCLHGDIGMNFPTTMEGWILYWTINGGTTAGNIALFVLFKTQAKINCKKHPNYIKANEILKKHREEKGFIPRSPNEMNLKEYMTKISMIVIFSVMSFIAITNLVISFDFITFLSCALSTIVALFMGWVTMIKNEAYWTDEYLEYALYIDKQSKNEEEPQGEIQNA